MADSKKYDGSQWEHSLRKLTTATEAVENPLYTDGTAITSYTIKGNTVQDGMPTPSNPVAVNGVGDKTANLLSGWTKGQRLDPTTGAVRTDTAEACTTDYIAIDKTKTYIAKPLYLNYNSFVAAYNASKQFLGRTAATQRSSVGFDNTSFPSGTPQGTGDIAYIRITIYNAGSQTGDIDDAIATETMMNEGSTALPYEPYGFKIPISLGGQTIDIYIGDLPLLKSLDGTAVDEISNGTLTRRVDSDGSVLPTPTTTQITMPSIPTVDGANTISVDTTVQPSEFSATWTGWHDSFVKEKSENLIPTNISDWEQGGISSTDGTDTASTIRLRTIDFYPINNNTDYYISVNDTDYCYVNIILYDSSKQYAGQYYLVDSAINGATALAINVPSSAIANVAYYRAVAKKRDDSTITAQEITDIKPMLNLGSTAQTYAPYWE